MMKHTPIILLGVILLGSSYWLGANQSLHQNPQFSVVDMNQIIHQTAETLAKKNLKPEHVQLQIAKFKTDLQKSLRAFAEQNKILIAPTNSLFGNVKDQTEDFIRFYNERTGS